MTAEDLELFRLLQRTYIELGVNVAMFATNWVAPKTMIEEYVLEKWGIDLELMYKMVKGAEEVQYD